MATYNPIAAADKEWNGLIADTYQCEKCDQNKDIKIVKYMGRNTKMLKWYQQQLVSGLEKKHGWMTRIFRKLTYTGPRG